jgi:hypothetical protein
VFATSLLFDFANTISFAVNFRRENTLDKLVWRFGGTWKTDNEMVQNHYLIIGSFPSQKHTPRNNTLFFTTLSHILITITLTHNAALLSGLCLLTSHALLMSLNPYELFYPKLLLFAGRYYS